MRYLKERGIQMYFEIENVNLFDPDAEAAITLSGAMGQEESRNLSENIPVSYTHLLSLQIKSQ